MTAVSLSHIEKRYGDVPVLKDINIDVEEREFMVFVGPSGCGKSTLLRTIAGLQRPAAGQVDVLGTDVLNADEDTRQALESRWGVMFQDGALFSSLTVRENVEVPMRAIKGLDPDIRRHLADLKVAMVGLPYLAGDKYPSELSGGMRKRAGLARTLALDPDIVFLDEPTAGLDPIGAAAFDQLIRGLSHSLDLTVFLVTHDLDTLHATCDRIAVLAERKVLVTGTMQDMLSVDHPWVHEYFHGPRARAAASQDPTRSDEKGD